jgi:hypothetical protein
MPISLLDHPTTKSGLPDDGVVDEIETGRNEEK